MTPRILVLMSTYKGEAFIAGQLDSLLAQDGVSCDVLVRDDGSSDGTCSILQEYCERHGNIRQLEDGDGNLGFAQSFWTLLQQAPKDYDAYAFCDQDDYWFPDKCRAAWEMLSRLGDKPGLYMSNVTPIDGEGNPMDVEPFHVTIPNRYRAFQQSILPGCTFVFNSRAKQLLSEFEGRMYAHDWAAFCIIRSFGQIIYDEEHRLTGYRLHGNNTIGAPGRVADLMARIKRFFAKSPCVRLHFAYDFYLCYADLINDEAFRQAVYDLGHYHKRFSSRIRLLFSRHFRGIVFKAYVLLGRV